MLEIHSRVHGYTMKYEGEKGKKKNHEFAKKLVLEGRIRTAIAHPT